MISPGPSIDNASGACGPPAASLSTLTSPSSSSSMCPEALSPFAQHHAARREGHEPHARDDEARCRRAAPSPSAG
ncbi:MAG: hypothetical protein U1F25_19410 [Rubrivivax sp.]